MHYYLPAVAETRFKGLWYFDENSLPRANLANPYNLEPRFKGHVTEAPVWNASLYRWTVFDAKKLVLEIGNFLDHKPTEIVRGISIAIDFRLMTPPTPLTMSTSPTWVQISSLSSDIEIGVFFRGSDRMICLGIKNSDGTW